VLECNVDILFSLQDSRRLQLQFPHGWEDAVTLLKQELARRSISQAYVKIGLPRKPRTTGEGSQSHHFNGHVQQIAAYTGDSFDDVKMHLKREAMSMGYPSHTTKFGEVVPESEANASTVECGYLIDTAHRIASEFGIILKET
jgi:hypothetical protein